MTLEELIEQENTLRKDAQLYFDSARIHKESAEKLLAEAESIAAEISCMKFGIAKGVRIRIDFDNEKVEGTLVRVLPMKSDEIFRLLLKDITCYPEDGDSFEIGLSPYWIVNKSQIEVL